MKRISDTDGNPAEIKARLEFPDGYDLNEFFALPGDSPLPGPDDLERIIPRQQLSAQSAVQKASLQFVDQYWVHEPYAFASIWRNERHEEYQYYAVEPLLTDQEQRIVEFLDAMLLSTMELQDQPTAVPQTQKKENISSAVGELMDQYNMWTRSDGQVTRSIATTLQKKLTSLVEWLTDNTGGSLNGPREISRDKSMQLSDYQVQKILYHIWRDHVWYGPINPLTEDPNIEDISCNGHESQVFVDHSGIGKQIPTNITFGQDELDEFVINLAQRSGKSISKRQPTVDATLPNNSRAQLTLGSEVSDKGTTFTIRQFRDVPFTPIDLLHWETMSLEQLVYLWFGIEHNMSAIIAGGTASGKTTSLNALTLFIPSTDRIVSIEDTRELTLAQSNFVPLVTRESSSRGDTHDIEEFDLLEITLRMRPDYIAVGEVRGEEARSMFQAMNTGHTTYTTFHAGSAEEAISRFTSEPLNVEPPLFQSVDMVLYQLLSTVEGERVRRLSTVEEIEEANADNDLEYSRSFSWDPETDSIRSYHSLSSSMLNEIKRKRGWSDAEFRNEWERRKLVLAYLSEKNIDSYAAVAAILQAYMSTPATVLSRMADGTLENRIEQLDEMETIKVDMDDEQEQDVPRPGNETLSEEAREQIQTVVSEGSEILDEYRNMDISFAQSREEVLEDADIEGRSPEAVDSPPTEGDEPLQPMPEPDSTEGNSRSQDAGTTDAPVRTTPEEQDGETTQERTDDKPTSSEVSSHGAGEGSDSLAPPMGGDLDSSSSGSDSPSRHGGEDDPLEDLLGDTDHPDDSTIEEIEDAEDSEDTL